MGTISKIIPDLGNGQSGLKKVFDRISERGAFASTIMEYEEIIQSGDYRHLNDLRGIIAF